MNYRLQGVSEKGRCSMYPLDDIFPVQPSHLESIAFRQSAVTEVGQQNVEIQVPVV